ncbi:MAG: DUF411 domain-containing protein [Magnetococcales bacterium]|nr:DUF411 domain-containing protein [Magnetococcales bacterium]
MKLGAMVAVLLVAIGVGWLLFPNTPQAMMDATVYKSPSCGCCTGWIEHLEREGFSVEVKDIADVSPIKQRLGVPDEAASCHTAQFGEYVVEGHVPAEDIRRMLKEKPAIDGIAAPGMPVGSPGMEIPGQPAERYAVVTFTEGRIGRTFANH